MRTFQSQLPTAKLAESKHKFVCKSRFMHSYICDTHTLKKTHILVHIPTLSKFCSQLRQLVMLSQANLQVIPFHHFPHINKHTQQLPQCCRFHQIDKYKFRNFRSLAAFTEKPKERTQFNCTHADIHLYVHR